MLSAYSSSGELPDGYIANIAKVLCQFPREVAVQACSPIHGIPRQCKQFRPNVGEVYEWCEIRTESIWENSKLERPALPAPEFSQAERDAGKAHIDRCLEKFMATRTVKKKWFDDLDLEQAKRNLGIVD